MLSESSTGLCGGFAGPVTRSTARIGMAVLALLFGCRSGGTGASDQYHMQTPFPAWLDSPAVSIAVVFSDKLDQISGDPQAGLSYNPEHVGRTYVDALNSIPGVKAWESSAPSYSAAENDVVDICKQLKRENGANAVLFCDARWRRLASLPIWLVPSSSLDGQFTYELRDAATGEVLLRASDSWNAACQGGLLYAKNRTLNQDLLAMTLAHRMNVLKALARGRVVGERGAEEVMEQASAAGLPRTSFGPSAIYAGDFE